MTMRFLEVLKKIGEGLLTGLKIGEKLALVSEPFVDLLFPHLAPLYNATASVSAAATQAASNAINKNNTEVQNFITVTEAITPILLNYAKTANLPTPTQDKINQYAQALLTTLSAL